MRHIICCIFLLTFAQAASGAQLTQEELCRNIEQAFSGINDMSYTYELGYRSSNSDELKLTPLIEATFWKKRPNLAKEDSVFLYMPEQPQYHYIFKLESDHYDTYEILKDGSVKKTSHPLEEWATSYSPDALYLDLKKRMAEKIPSSIEYQVSQNIYVLKFDAPDKATFEISGQSWMPLSVTVFDKANNAFVTTRWSNININPGLSDEMFRVPADKVKTGTDVPAAAQFGGHYDVTKGVNPDGSTYKAHVIIEDLGRDLHRVVWRFREGGDSHGVGIQDDGVLGVGYSDAPGFGVIVYKVEGGKLSGEWVDDQTEEEYGYEDLEGPPGLSGEYTITNAAGPDYGDEYTGTVTIRRFGDVYRLNWNIGNDVYTGVGLLKNDLLIVGWGERAGVVFYEKDGDTLKGKWANQIDSTTGVESLFQVYGEH